MRYSSKAMGTVPEPCKISPVLEPYLDMEAGARFRSLSRKRIGRGFFDLWLKPSAVNIASYCYLMVFFASSTDACGHVLPICRMADSVPTDTRGFQSSSLPYLARRFLPRFLFVRNFIWLLHILPAHRENIRNNSASADAQQYLLNI